MLTRSITLFRLFGFPVKVDASWLLLAVLVVWSLSVGFFPAAYPGFTPTGYLWMGIIGLLGLAFSIVVHELAHALVARRYDLPIRSITLFVFGGVADMAEEPNSPKAEFLMAGAGPAMSFVVALFFWVLASFVAPFPESLTVVLAYLATINLILAIFNLVPAFPLDGGRMLRAGLWAWKKDILPATRIAAAMGSGFGILLILLGLWTFIQGNFIGGAWWFLIGMFVRAASAGALEQTTARTALAGRRVRDLMRPDPVTVPPDLPVDRLVQGFFYRYYYKFFPVAEDGRLIGCVSIDEVKEIEPERWPKLRVADIQRACNSDNTIDPDADATQALARMQRGRLSRLMVSRNGRLLGILSLKDLLAYLAMREQLGEAPDELPAKARERAFPPPHEGRA